MYIVLPGDSTFNNWAYADDEPDVAGHHRTHLDPLDQVTLLARDGDTTTAIERQLTGHPTEALCTPTDALAVF